MMYQQCGQQMATKSQAQVKGGQELVVAARQGDIEQVKRLVESGMSVNAVDEFGMTSLMLLAAQGLSEGVKLLLDQPTCLVNKRTSSMLVALHFAAEKGHIDCVELLLRQGAVINVSDDWGETPLIKAAGGGAGGFGSGSSSSSADDSARRVSVVSLLLNNGARTDMIDLHGRDALVHAARSGTVGAVRALLTHGADPNHGSRALALHEAAAFGHVGCVDVLLGAGARANLRNLHGHLPLELATHMDHSPVVECLLRRAAAGSSPEARNAALAMAVASNATACLALLLHNGANPDAMDSSGVPALHIAVEMNNTEAVRLLVRYNATVDRRLYQKLVLHDADVRAVCAALSVDYVTPLMLAVVRGGRGHLVQVLVRAGASVGVLQRMICEPDVLQLLNALTADEALLALLTERCSAPLALQRLSALAIRTRFLSERIDTIYDLPLPRSLLDFVAFADLNAE